CWEKEYSSTSDVFSKLSKKLCETGYVEKGDVERYILQRCRNMEKIIDGINESHARLLESRIKQNKTEVFAMDYEAMAHLLESAVKINGKEYVPDAKLCENLKKASRRMNFKAHNICVYGNRKLSIVAGGVDITKVKMSANEIRTCYENICGVKLTTPKFDVDGEYITMTLEAAKRFKTEYAAAFDTKKNEKICGDMICMFENDADYFYSLISDGMGSGKEAALTSRLCGIFLKKMLVAGNSKPVALEMLNNFIRSKNTECFATVDLLEIDLIKGKAGFIKGGAAASYVLRDDKIFRISSNTMPVGITREINAEEVKFELKDNDVIVMVSDGVGQSAEDMARISDVLTYSWEDDLQKMADKILKNATSSCKRSDDVSVGLIRVKEI
ncbi:MAG: SpoIIE family protein phosphatase, partial [Clostridia bacterium]|nr:SpoIIE family protein phosphatase [Clostridia bacterium]